jgi:S1-C subfamily serine protease
MAKVLGEACGDEVEGSAFSVGTGLLVTNAHVVAGETATNVELDGNLYGATVVFFDPTFDMAVLHSDGPVGPALTLDPSLVGRGIEGAVLGYPENGPLTVGTAGVAASINATSHNIYDQKTVTRQVYQIDADVQPGNSGGPLVATDGEVIGIVFSKSTTTTDVGYALGSPQVLKRLNAARHLTKAVGTGGCTEG